MSLEGLSSEQVAGLANLMKTLSENPETRREIQRLTKKVSPGSVFPELEIEDAVAKVRAESSEREEKLRDELKNDRIALKRKELQAELASDFPNIAFDDIEKAMVENGIANHKTAATFLHNQRRLAEPAPEIPGRGGPMQMPSEAKQFLKDPINTARRLAHEAMTDIINARAKRAA